MRRRSAKPVNANADGDRRHVARDAGSALGLPDIPEDALAADLRAAVAQLTAERDRLQGELANARDRIAALEHLADEDSLTGVANRRAFVRHLTRTIAVTHRHGVPASIIYFDVNNLKLINDMHGHPAGDAALRHIANLLHDKIRSSDIVGRLGGDEFGVVLAYIDEKQARKKAAALAATIAETPVPWGDLAIPVTAAYGVYAFSGTVDPQHAIEAADRAMYQQKRANSHPGA
jgi:diguanylate cyclase (GGDEF)-like protein